MTERPAGVGRAPYERVHPLRVLASYDLETAPHTCGLYCVRPSAYGKQYAGPPSHPPSRPIEFHLSSGDRA